MIDVHPKIWQDFSQFSIGYVITDQIQCQESTEFTTLQQEEQRRWCRDWNLSGSSFSTHLEQWHLAFRKFGAKPKRSPPSLESLARTVTKNGCLPAINSIVDLYNSLSLQFKMPMGAEDLDRISGKIILTYSRGKPFQGLGDTETRLPKSGEVVYEDDDKTLCRRWNWRQCELTKIQKSTNRAIFMIEAMGENAIAELPAALQALEDQLNSHRLARVLDKRIL